jgi:pyruvate carboxylase
MALFLFSKGIKAEDVVNLEPGSMPFPESVIDMLSGGLGWPSGGFPEPVQRVVLGEKRFKEAQAAFKAGKVGNRAEPVNLDKLRKELAEKLRREATDDDLYSHLMYPQVFADFAKRDRRFGGLNSAPVPVGSA